MESYLIVVFLNDFLYIGLQTPFTKPSNSKVRPSNLEMAGELGKRFGCCIPRLGIGRVSSDICLSFSHVEKKVSMRLWWICVWVDSYVFCRWLNRLNFEVIVGGKIYVCIQSEEIWELKDVLKSPCLILWYKSLLCVLMIFLTHLHIQNRNTDVYTWFNFMLIFYVIPVYPTIPKYHSLNPGTWPADGSTSKIILRGAKKNTCATRINMGDWWTRHRRHASVKTKWFSEFVGQENSQKLSLGNFEELLPRRVTQGVPIAPEVVWTCVRLVA